MTCSDYCKYFEQGKADAKAGLPIKHATGSNKSRAYLEGYRSI